MGDAVAHGAPVLLQLRLAFAAEGAPAALAGEVRPRALQAGKKIFLAGQFHLEHGLAGVRAVGENLEDHLLPVDDGQRGFLLPVALLGRRERLVDHDDVGARRLGLRDHLGDLAAAEKEGGDGAAQVDEVAAGDGQAEVLDQFPQFREQLGALARRHARGLHADQVCVEDALILVEQLGHKGSSCGKIRTEARAKLREIRDGRESSGRIFDFPWTRHVFTLPFSMKIPAFFMLASIIALATPSTVTGRTRGTSGRSGDVPPHRSRRQGRRSAL